MTRVNRARIYDLTVEIHQVSSAARYDDVQYMEMLRRVAEIQRLARTIPSQKEAE